MSPEARKDHDRLLRVECKFARAKKRFDRAAVRFALAREGLQKERRRFIKKYRAEIGSKKLAVLRRYTLEGAAVEKRAARTRGKTKPRFLGKTVCIVKSPASARSLLARRKGKR